MICNVILTAQPGDSKQEIEEEFAVIKDIMGVGDDKIFTTPGKGRFECEFHEFYMKVKERIMRKIKAYE